MEGSPTHPQLKKIEEQLGKRALTNRNWDIFQAYVMGEGAPPGAVLAEGTGTPGRTTKREDGGQHCKSDSTEI